MTRSNKYVRDSFNFPHKSPTNALHKIYYYVTVMMAACKILMVCVSNDVNRLHTKPGVSIGGNKRGFWIQNLLVSEC